MSDLGNKQVRLDRREPMMRDSPKYEERDVIVVGAGPAGAASARVLAERGYSVLVLERLEFPRFHIGESLLTYGAALLDRLDLIDAVRDAGFPVKTGAEFCDADGRASRVDFTDQGPGRFLTTFQVERADFDKLLIDHAAKAGAEVRHRCRVNRLEIEGARVVGVGYSSAEGSGTVRARRVLDASGRYGLISHQHLKARRIIDQLRMVSIFRHYEGVREEHNPGVAGDIQIGSHRDGWVWAIPIRRNKLSIGIVTLPEIVQQFGGAKVFDEHVGRIPRIRQRLSGSLPVTDVRGESDFTYYTERLAGPGFFVLGDAGCFVDPIFSAGVLLAMCTGYRAAELTAEVLDGSTEEETATSLYTRFYKTGYDTYFRLILAFYKHGFKIGRFLKSTGVRVDPVWLSRLLAGDFWSQKNALANHLRGIEEFAIFEPYEPLFGCPVYPAADAEEPDPGGLGSVEENVGTA